MTPVLQTQKSLKSYHTFQVEVLAKFFVEITKEEDIYWLISQDVWTRYPHVILGAWANLLFTQDYEGIVVKISLLGKDILGEVGESTHIRVSAWEDRHAAMMWMLGQWYVWCENLVYIPGQVGAAPIGNIWAYGKEAKDIIYQVEAIDLSNGEKHLFTNDQCKFAYRDSIFKSSPGRFLITAVIFTLQKYHSGYQPDVSYQDIQDMIVDQWLSNLSALDVAALITTIRQKKLPDRHSIWTAGSFFKNPIVEKELYQKLVQKYPQLIWWPLSRDNLPYIKLSAGQLIEMSWYKWYRKGAVWVSEKHALVLLHYGWWKGSDIVDLFQTIQKKVKQQFAVDLEPEVLCL